MTKKVRVENADTSDHKLIVQVWEKGAGTESGGSYPDFLIETKELQNPADMLDFLIYSTRYLVVKEAE